MYFLSHLFVLFKALPKNFPIELLKPLMIGCYSPDAGYFPHFSWQLRIFKHTENPPLYLYNERKKRLAFTIGWNVHLLCDKITHTNAFYENHDPFCDKIIKNKGLWKLLNTAKNHLTKEIGLDLHILNNWLSNEKQFVEILRNKSTYSETDLNFPGFNFFRKYIYLYINKALPMISNTNRIKKIINYQIYQENEIKEKIANLLELTIKESKKIIEEKI